MKRMLVCLLLVGIVGCGGTEDVAEQTPSKGDVNNSAKPAKELTLENRLEAKVRDALEEKLPNDISINNIHIIANPEY